MAESRGPWGSVVPNWANLTVHAGCVSPGSGGWAITPCTCFGALEQARKAACASNLKQIGIACQAWAAGHKQNWPCGYDPKSERWDEVGGTRSEDRRRPGRQRSRQLQHRQPVVAASRRASCRTPVCSSARDGVTKAEPDGIALYGKVARPRFPRPARSCSYSFQNVLPGSSGYVLTSSASPALAVAADANPMRRDFWSGAPDGSKNGVTDKRLAENLTWRCPAGERPRGHGNSTAPTTTSRARTSCTWTATSSGRTTRIAARRYDNIWLPQVYGAARRDDLPQAGLRRIWRRCGPTTARPATTAARRCPLRIGLTRSWYREGSYKFHVAGFKLQAISPKRYNLIALP